LDISFDKIKIAEVITKNERKYIHFIFMGLELSAVIKKNDINNNWMVVRIEFYSPRIERKYGKWLRDNILNHPHLRLKLLANN